MSRWIDKQRCCAYCGALTDPKGLPVSCVGCAPLISLDPHYNGCQTAPMLAATLGEAAQADREQASC